MSVTFKHNIISALFRVNSNKYLYYFDFINLPDGVTIVSKKHSVQNYLGKHEMTIWQDGYIDLVSNNEKKVVDYTKIINIFILHGYVEDPFPQEKMIPIYNPMHKFTKPEMYTYNLLSKWNVNLSFSREDTFKYCTGTRGGNLRSDLHNGDIFIEIDGSGHKFTENDEIKDAYLKDNGKILRRYRERHLKDGTFKRDIMEFIESGYIVLNDLYQKPLFSYDNIVSI